MPNLSILKIDRFFDLTPSNSATPSIQIVPLLQLQKLLWKLQSIANEAIFFDSIYAPQLSELDIHCWKWDPDTIQDFLCRSRCSIKSLKLHMVTDSRAPSLLLSSLLDLEVVMLDEVVICKEFVEKLKFDEAKSSWLAPKLKKLILADVYCDKKLQDEVAQMIQSRLRVPLVGEGRGSRLECLEIQHNSVRVVNDSGDVWPHDPCNFLQERFTDEEMKLITLKVEGTSNTDSLVCIFDYVP